MSRRIRASGVLLEDAFGYVLFLRSVTTGLWELPGGHLEEGEAPIDAALRELEEETGLSVPFRSIHPQPIVTSVPGSTEDYWAWVAPIERMSSPRLALSEHDAHRWALPGVALQWADLHAGVAATLRIRGSGRWV